MRSGLQRSGVPLVAAAALLVVPASAAADAWPALDDAAQRAGAATTAVARDAAADERLGDRLANRWNGAGPGASAYVRDVEGGSAIYESRPDAKRIPASVTKLFTVVAALREEGPDFAATTEVRVTGAREGDVWRGNLYLVGAGDGTLDRQRIRQLARSTRTRLGVRRLSGRVFADDSTLDRRRGAARTGGAYDPDMGGVLGALTVSGGFVPGGGDPGRRAASLLREALRKAGLRTGTGIGRAAAPASAVAQVVAPAPPLSDLARSILRPSDNFLAELLVKQLATPAGILAACQQDELAADAVEGAQSAPEDAPATTQAAAPATTDAAGSARCVRTDAPPASTAAGIRRVRQSLRGIGLSPTLNDGSGLSRRNRVTARQVVSLATTAATDPALRPVLTAGLPVAGRSGTLRRRMRGTPAAGRCWAKTGTLNGVSTLGGWCRTAGGRKIAFGLLQNGTDVGGAQDRQDAFLATLAADRSR